MSKIQNAWKKFAEKLTDEEIMVANATTTKVSWGPTPDEIDKVIDVCRGPQQQRVLAYMFQQMGDPKSDWRVVYKSLLMIEYMSLHADMSVVDYFKRNIHEIRKLQSYEFRDKEGTDKGINVRKRSETVADEIEDPDLSEKRQEAQAQKNKYRQAVGSDFSGFEGGSSMGGGYQSDNAYGGGIGGGESAFGNERPAAPEEQNVEQEWEEEPAPETEQYEAPPEPVEVEEYQQPPQPVETFQAPPEQPYAAPQEIQQFPAQPEEVKPFEPPQPEYEQPVEIEEQKPARQPDLLDDIFGAPSAQPTNYEQSVPEQEPNYQEEQPSYQEEEPAFTPQEPAFTPQQPTFEQAQEPTFQPAQQEQPYQQEEYAEQPQQRVTQKKKDDLASLLDF